MWRLRAAAARSMPAAPTFLGGLLRLCAPSHGQAGDEGTRALRRRRAPPDLAPGAHRPHPAAQQTACSAGRTSVASTSRRTTCVSAKKQDRPRPWNLGRRRAFSLDDGHLCAPCPPPCGRGLRPGTAARAPAPPPGRGAGPPGRGAGGFPPRQRVAAPAPSRARGRDHCSAGPGDSRQGSRAASGPRRGPRVRRPATGPRASAGPRSGSPAARRRGPRRHARRTPRGCPAAAPARQLPAPDRHHGPDRRLKPARSGLDASRRGRSRPNKAKWGQIGPNKAN